MHSSRMRTARFIGQLGGRVSVWRVSTQGCVYLGSCLPMECVCLGGVHPSPREQND